MSDTNKTIARRIPLEAFNKGQVAVFDEVAAADMVDHFPPPGLPAGREGYKQFVGVLRSAFPDLHYNLQLELAEGDKVVHKVAVTGTHQGAFMGIPATGRAIQWTETHMMRFDNGKLVEHWGNADQAALMMQLMPPGQ